MNSCHNFHSNQDLNLFVCILVAMRIVYRHAAITFKSLNDNYQKKTTILYHGTIIIYAYPYIPSS